LTTIGSHLLLFETDLNTAVGHAFVIRRTVAFPGTRAPLVSPDTFRLLPALRAGRAAPNLSADAPHDSHLPAARSIPP
jgi:hypothetical protein